MSPCSARPRASNQSNQPETTDQGIGEDNGVALATDSNRRGTSTNAPNDRVIRSADCLLDGLIRCPTRQASRRPDRIGRRDAHHGRSARSAQEKFGIFVPSPASQGNEPPSLSWRAIDREVRPDEADEAGVEGVAASLQLLPSCQRRSEAPHFVPFKTKIAFEARSPSEYGRRRRQGCRL
jgi:hypothetical protein